MYCMPETANVWEDGYSDDQCTKAAMQFSIQGNPNPAYGKKSYVTNSPLYRIIPLDTVYFFEFECQERDTTGSGNHWTDTEEVGPSEFVEFTEE